MTHDPLCPHDSGAYDQLGENSCSCDLIVKVRADTLDKAREAARWAMAEHVLAPDEETTVGLLRRIDAAIDALRGES